MKLPTIEQIKQAHATTAASGLGEFEKALCRLQNWGRLADKLNRRGNLTDEEAELVCQIKHRMSRDEYAALPEEEDEELEAPVEMSFARWYELADMPAKTKNGWIDLETGIPFSGVKPPEKIETMGVDIFVATGPVD